MVEDLETQSRLLASADVDVIVLGATAPSFLKGAGYDREVIARIEKATGKPATTTSTALLRALRFLGAKRIVLGSAYDDKVNAIAQGFLEANGFKVVAARGLGMVDNLAVGRLGPESAYELARGADRTDADAMVLACTNWRTMDAIERLERELGKPVRLHHPGERVGRAADGRLSRGSPGLRTAAALAGGGSPSRGCRLSRKTGRKGAKPQRKTRGM